MTISPSITPGTGVSGADARQLGFTEERWPEIEFLKTRENLAACGTAPNWRRARGSAAHSADWNSSGIARDLRAQDRGAARNARGVVFGPFMSWRGIPAAAKLGAQPRIAANGRILGVGSSSRRTCHVSQTRTSDQGRREHHHQLFAVGIGNVQHFQQTILRILIEGQDPFAPQLAQRVEAQTRIGQPA
jgi:hypothetical protein